MIDLMMAMAVNARVMMSMVWVTVIFSDGDDVNGVMAVMSTCVTVMMTKSMSSRWYQWQVFAGWGKPGKQSQRFV